MPGVTKDRPIMYMNDREEYTRMKTEFVEYINAMARSEKQIKT